MCRGLKTGQLIPALLAVVHGMYTTYAAQLHMAMPFYVGQIAGVLWFNVAVYSNTQVLIIADFCYGLIR